MKWYNIINKADHAEVWIYEEIGEDYWTGGGVTAKNFQKELAAIKAPQIDLHINSPGGVVFEGIAIYNLLRQHPSNVTTYIDGLAASVASVVALAGNHIIMAENALFMIHKASGIVVGTSDDMRDFAGKLDKVNDSIATTYISKTGKEEPEINDMMAAETWMNADEALEAGFVDEISGKMDMAACAKFVPVMTKLGFKKVPETFNPKQTPSAKEAERALRDVGFSVKTAKAILVKGLSDDLRDVDPPEDPDPVPDPLRDVEPKKPITNDKTQELLIKADLASQ